jgi:hypothetical protein
VNRRELLGFAAVACVACCVGPILGVLGAIAALGVASTLFVGVAGLAITATAIASFIVVRNRRTSSCATGAEPVAIELTRRPTP